MAVMFSFIIIISRLVIGHLIIVVFVRLLFKRAFLEIPKTTRARKVVICAKCLQQRFGFLLILKN